MDEEINKIILNHNTIQDPIISEKIELKIQKLYNISIPSIILEYLTSENEEFELEDLKQFFNNFGEVLNIVITDKKSIVLFKTFFIANICKEFLQTENNFKENMKNKFKVRWFDFEKDSELLMPKIKPIFKEIYNKNIINLKPISTDNQSSNKQDNTNNNIGIKMNMNMNMNINNFNINATMNPMAQNQGIAQLQYLQFLKMAQLNQMRMKNIPPNTNFPQGPIPNYNFPMNPIQMQQQQMINNLNLNMLMKQQNLVNMNNQANMNNNINLMNNNNINNPQFNQNNQNMNQKNFNQNQNNNNSNDEKNFSKYTCKYEILIANDKDFHIARRLIGSKGCNMKKIINQCKTDGDGEGIKLRLRGKGNGYKEGPDSKESDEPLHLCISAKNPEEMKRACLLVDELLDTIHEDYKEYCGKNKITPLSTQIAARIENKNFNYKVNNNY